MQLTIIIFVFQAASNARTVGVEISRLLRAINDSGVSLRKNVHLLGHSLGAQVLFGLLISETTSQMTNIRKIMKKRLAAFF